MDYKKAKPTKIPNIFEMQTGGHLCRARVTDPVTGKLREIKKVLPEADLATAFQWLQAEIARIKGGKPLPPVQKVRFSEFAKSLFEEKVTKGEIKSAKGRERWGYTLEHLIAGTTVDETDTAPEKHVVGLGDMFIDKIHLSHVEDWKLRIAELIGAGDYSPTTVNGWLSILRVIDRAAKRRFDLPAQFTEGVSDFNTSEVQTYTPEEPNALLPEQVPLFLEKLREDYPQHYAMSYLGFATGLRPSSLRPLRRKGPEADVLWQQNRIWIRRSQTLGDEVLRTTKTRKRYPIDLPEDVMAVLTWHAETQLVTPEMQDSDLLFPSVTGGFRAPTVLNKPFAEIATELGLPPFTQRGLRRTFQDLARSAQVQSLVKRSISGHATEAMEHHYSTVAPAEQRESIAKVIRLFGRGGPTSAASIEVGGTRSGTSSR